MQGVPIWQRVVDCFNGTKLDPIRLAIEAKKSEQDLIDLASTLNENLAKLRRIERLDLPIQVVPDTAELGEAIDIFDRINSQGVKLTDAELALTHVTAKWPDARRQLKQKMVFCGDRKFEFGLTFMTRALVTTVTGRALFEQIHSRSKPELESGWSRLDKILDYLMSVLPTHAYVHGTDDLNTTNALIPIVAYLSRTGGTFPSQRSIAHAVNWLYAALIWARYTAQTDQRLEADLSIVAKELEPWAALSAQIVEQRGRIDVKPDDFEGRTAQHPLYRMIYVLMKAHGAVDWFNGVPLGQTVGAAYSLHSRHVFPQALLYKSGWDVGNYIHRQTVNEISNRAFLTATSNIQLSATEPSAYLPDIEAKYPGALASQFIPDDPELWHVTRYNDFLATRRALLARKLNQHMAQLIAEPEEVRHRPIAELVKLGESSTLEFKSTFQWDVKQGQQNKSLRRSVLKSVAALMNSEGGTLIIGVEDDGQIFGLERDIWLFGSRDKFEQALVNLVVGDIGPGLSHYYRIRFEEIFGKLVCVVEVDPVRGKDGVFVKGDNPTKGKEFFVRIGNTTRSLDPEQTHAYLESRVD